MRLVLGTRGSLLARTQSETVAQFLRERGFQVEVRIYKTAGDIHLDRPLSAMPNKGAFTKELEDALSAREIDLAVHSLKDLPSEFPQGLTVCYFPDRQDPRDALVAPKGSSLSLKKLSSGVRIGTSSVRRSAQLLAVNPNFVLCSLRGNVDTRLRKLDDGEFDAIILAGAGLDRLGFSDRISERLDPFQFLPTPAQGCLGIEFRSDDLRISQVFSEYQNSSAIRCVRAERAFLSVFGGGCSAPLGALATEKNGVIELQAALWSADGKNCWRETQSSENDPEQLGEYVAKKLSEKVPAIKFPL